MAWLLPVNWWNILHVFLVSWFLKMFVFSTCCPHVKWATEKLFLFCFLFSYYLLFKILLLPIIFLRFLFLLYPNVGLLWNEFFSLLFFICNKWQYLSMTSLIFGRVLFNFITSWILGLFTIFSFEYNKASFVTSDISMLLSNNFWCIGVRTKTFRWPVGFWYLDLNNLLFSLFL